MKDHFQRGEGGETIGEMRMHRQESMGERVTEEKFKVNNTSLRRTQIA